MGVPRDLVVKDRHGRQDKRVLLPEEQDYGRGITFQEYFCSVARGRSDQGTPCSFAGCGVSLCVEP